MTIPGAIVRRPQWNSTLVVHLQSETCSQMLRRVPSKLQQAVTQLRRSDIAELQRPTILKSKAEDGLARALTSAGAEERMCREATGQEAAGGQSRGLYISINPGCEGKSRGDTRKHGEYSPSPQSLQ